MSARRVAPNGRRLLRTIVREGESAKTAAGLPALRPHGSEAACSPIPGLYDRTALDAHTARQLSALCARCVLQDTCLDRRTDRRH